MKAVGLITEYNPFHKGHLYHLGESRRLSGADVTVAVMGGHFLQRGEPALVDKWTRAKMAVAAGVDMVVELPLPWACASAPDFARGGVQALDALGVSTLCFGTESGSLTELQAWAKIELEHQDVIAKRCATLLRQGVSYPAAREQVLRDHGLVVSAQIAGPNNILGLEYLKELVRQNSFIEAITVRRIGSGFHESEVIDGIASASGIRQSLRQGLNIAEFLPVASAQQLQKVLEAGQIYNEKNYFTLLLGRIFQVSTELERFWLVEDGIDRRIIEAADCATDLEELISAIKARQLTRTRVQRLLLALVLGIEKQTANELLMMRPAYLHLLAVSTVGERFLAATRKQRTIPLIQNFSRIIANLKRCYDHDSQEYLRAWQQLQLQLKASRLYSLLLENPPKGSRNRDFFQDLERFREY
jgi:predicted nucleotidyltransferase